MWVVRPSWPPCGPEPCVRSSSAPWSCARSSSWPWSCGQRSCEPEPSAPWSCARWSCGQRSCEPSPSWPWSCVRSSSARRSCGLWSSSPQSSERWSSCCRGLARGGLPGRGLAGRRLPRRGLARGRLPGRGLAGSGLAGRCLARGGLASRSLLGSRLAGRGLARGGLASRSLLRRGLAGRRLARCRFTRSHGRLAGWCVAHARYLLRCCRWNRSARGRVRASLERDPACMPDMLGTSVSELCAMCTSRDARIQFVSPSSRAVLRRRDSSQRPLAHCVLVGPLVVVPQRRQCRGEHERTQHAGRTATDDGERAATSTARRGSSGPVPAAVPASTTAARCRPSVRAPRRGWSGSTSAGGRSR